MTSAGSVLEDVIPRQSLLQWVAKAFAVACLLNAVASPYSKRLTMRLLRQITQPSTRPTFFPPMTSMPCGPRAS